jgi:hypothetical protein
MGHAPLVGAVDADHGDLEESEQLLRMNPPAPDALGRDVIDNLRERRHTSRSQARLPSPIGQVVVAEALAAGRAPSVMSHIGRIAEPGRVPPVDATPSMVSCRPGGGAMTQRRRLRPTTAPGRPFA